MVTKSFKITFQILNILIFNIFLAQSKPDNQAKSVEIDTLKKQKDTTIVIPKEPLESVVKSKADNIRNDFPKSMTYLNKNAQIIYQDMQIDADYISIDSKNSLIYARGMLDKNGRIIKPAKATQGGKEYEYEEIQYNTKTKQALAFNARTEENEGVIVAEKTKKLNDSVFFMRRGIYTTDDYFLKKKDSLADYHLQASIIKLVKTKKNSTIVTGPVQMYIEQVPTPLILPFSILPFSDKRSAGILIPSFGEREDVGFYISGLGYYQPLGEYFDFKAYLDLYTKGSWNVRPEVNYKKNYKYSGSFSADVGTTIRGIKGLDDYSKNDTYRFMWRHTQDPKANPFFNFSASVDIVSNKFYNNTTNNSHIFNQNVLNTQQNSSISITKRFLNLPITITGNASYSQNFATELVDLKLPNLNVSMNQFYLLKPKSGIRKGLLENINVNTGLQFSNSVSTKQDDMFSSDMWDKMQTGLKNNIDLNSNTSILKYVTFSVRANVNNVLTNKTVTKMYDPVSTKVETNTNKGISGFSTFSTSASLQTVLYGMLNFKKNAAIQKVRHMMTPSIGFTYTPDFSESSWGYYKSYVDGSGNEVVYSKFEGGIYGSPGSGLVQALNFSLSNNLEMKVKSKKDSTGIKKVKIFETLNVTGGYNFAAESFKWSMFNVTAQTSFFNNKLTANASMLIDPYEVVFAPGAKTGTRVENFGHFRVDNFNLQLSFPLSDALFGKKEELNKKYSTKGSIMQEGYYFDDDGYARFSQPWNLNVSAQYNYRKGLELSGTKSASVGLDGSIKLTPFWNITGGTYYDVIEKELAYTRLGFSREQRSFLISFNWVPIGQYKVYDFLITIKANILKDAVKYESRNFNRPTSTF